MRQTHFALYLEDMINPKKNRPAGSRFKSLIVTLLIDVGACFLRRMGPVIQQIGLNFGPPATDGVLLARANVRHWFNIGNRKTMAKKRQTAIGSRADCSAEGGRSDMR